MKSKKEKKTDREKILEALAYCKEKYKQDCNYVEINVNAEFSIKKDAIDGVTIKKVKNILPDQCWIAIKLLE
jgi:hypothetical protein